MQDAKSTVVQDITQLLVSYTSVCSLNVRKCSPGGSNPVLPQGHCLSSYVWLINLQREHICACILCVLVCLTSSVLLARN